MNHAVYNNFLRNAGLLTLLFFWTVPTILAAAEKISVTLTVRDSLTSPNQPATIEATLTETGLLTKTGLGGQPIELLIAGKVVATATTDGDGRAVLSYLPKAQGAIPLTVRLGATSRVAETEANANLAVWERRGPMMAVEIAALMEDAESRHPMTDAAEELGKLTQFYYNVLYVVTQDLTVGAYDQVNEQARQWLKDHTFPVGHILVLPSGPEALGTKLDEMHAAGWTTLKIGVGRTKAFAEAFLQRRLDAVMVPEPAQGEAPRKAKVAKEWKDVRKKM
ncbi:MAG: hypothetical protein SGJ16_11135 [Nitrospirota bacterium]|nr:hypothetical protein [Nitrospirota bacterium]